MRKGPQQNLRVRVRTSQVLSQSDLRFMEHEEETARPKKYVDIGPYRKPLQYHSIKYRVLAKIYQAEGLIRMKTKPKGFKFAILNLIVFLMLSWEIDINEIKEQLRE